MNSLQNIFHSGISQKHTYFQFLLQNIYDLYLTHFPELKESVIFFSDELCYILLLKAHDFGNQILFHLRKTVTPKMQTQIYELKLTIF